MIQLVRSLEPHNIAGQSGMFIRGPGVAIMFDLNLSKLYVQDFIPTPCPPSLAVKIKDKEWLALMNAYPGTRLSKRPDRKDFLARLNISEML
jgi:hypothetical protein